MSETRDFRVEYSSNHPTHIPLSQGDEIVNIKFCPATKWRHSTLEVDFVRNGVEQHASWHWCEMPRELASKCELLLNVQRDISLFLLKLSGLDGEDDITWRAE